MGDLWGYLLLAGRFLFPAAGIAATVLLLFWVTRRFAGHPGPPAGPDGPEGSETGSDRRSAARTGSAVALAGLCLPWLVGLAVKLRLDAAGEPTHPLSSFLDPTTVAVLLFATAVQWCWPLLLLAAWIRSRHFRHLAPRRSFRERILVARLTALGGLIGEALVFARVFRVWDAMYIFVPIAFFLLPGMGLGWGCGMVLTGRRRRPDEPGTVA